MTLLGLLPAVATFAVTHYIAHSTPAATARGCRGCSGLPEISFPVHRLPVPSGGDCVQTLEQFLPLQRKPDAGDTRLRAAGLWGAFATALCQGLAWFKRLALIGFLAMMLRISFGWFITLKWPSAEMAMLATAFALLANLGPALMEKGFVAAWRASFAVEPEFVQYFVVSAAFVVGNYCFFQGDCWWPNKFFSSKEN